MDAFETVPQGEIPGNSQHSLQEFPVTRETAGIVSIHLGVPRHRRDSREQSIFTWEFPDTSRDMG